MPLHCSPGDRMTPSNTATKKKIPNNQNLSANLNKGNFLNQKFKKITKIYNKPTVNLVLNGEKLKFPLWSTDNDV